MARSETTRHPFAPLLMLASALALLVASVTPGLHPASADQFTPLEDPPSILVNTANIVVGAPQEGEGDEVTGSMDPTVTEGSPFTSFTAFQPAATRSTEIYNVFATITTNGQLNNVTRVRFCLYDSDDDAYTDVTVVDTDCSIPTGQATSAALPAISAVSEPKRLMVMEWAAGTPATITVVGDNNYADAGTFFDLGNVTENVDANTRSATIRFSFQVSNAMQVSSDWKIRMAAESQATIEGDTQDEQSAIDTPAAPLTVNYFAEMTTNRADAAAIDYGIVVPGVTVLKTGTGSEGASITSGAYTANDQSALTVAATRFFNGGTAEDPTNTIELATNGDISQENQDRRTVVGGDTVTDIGLADGILNVPNGQVSLDCAFDDDVDLTDGEDVVDDAAKFIQVRNAARVLATARSATDEDASSLANHSCMLNYPGGGPVANVLYSNTVTLGLIQGAGTLGGGGS